MTDERTKEQINAEIARRLFGWHLTNWGSWDDKDGLPVLRSAIFASDHNAALGLVVPEMRRRGYEFMAEDFAAQSSIRVWFVKGSVMGSSRVPFGQEPRAICLAALAALDQERTNIATAEYSLCPFCYKSLDGEIGFHYECGQREERRSEWESEQRAALDAEEAQG